MTLKNIYMLAPLALSTLLVEAKEKPNVIYIMADDLGIGDVGCYYQTKIKTPAIDKMAENGIKFTQHYSGTSVSAPSRCVLMTGKHTGVAAIRGNKNTQASDGERYSTALPAEEVTVAEIMKQAGYATACFGKWGLGSFEDEGVPHKQGFDYFLGYLSQMNAHSYYPQFIYENDKKVQLDKKVYTHDLIMDKALSYIEENADKPFFIYLAPTLPHTKLEFPKGELGEYETMFGEAEGKNPRAIYAAMVSRLDRDVQRVIDLLEEKGILKNTIVVFTSDNGTANMKLFDSNGPYRGMKRDLYEGGIRTPFVVQWEGTIKPGTTSNHVSAFWDFLPTLCQLTGEKVPETCTGISYLPTLTDKGTQAKHKSLYFEMHEKGGSQAVIQYPWKLIKLQVNNSAKTKYELYNLSEDIGEENNLLGSNPTKTEELKELMQESRTDNKLFNFAKSKKK